MKTLYLAILAVILCSPNVSLGNSSENVTTILSDSTGRIWASSGAFMYSSFDTGTSWRVVPGVNGRVLFRTRAGTFLTGADRGTYRSTEGQFWVHVDSGFHSRGFGGDGVNGFVQDRSNTIYAATGHGIYRSTDEGLSWLSSGLYDSVHVRLDSSLSSIAFDSNGIFLAGHTNIGAYRSHDGRNWIALDSPMKYVAPTAIGVTSRNLIFAGSGRRIFISSNDGVTWIEKDFGLLSTAINQILIDERDNIYLATLGGVYVSNDLGQSWELLGRGQTDDWINAITRLPSGDMAAAGLHGVYFYSHTDSTWREIDNNWKTESVVYRSSRQSTQLRIFPNPASSVVNVEGLQQSENGQCIIFDAIGRQVFQTALSEEPLQLNIAALLPGVYRIVCHQNGDMSVVNLTVAR